MKMRLTKSFLYALFLHGTVVLLVIALIMASRSEEKTVGEKRCKVMMSQVCHCLPEKTEQKPPVAEQQKKVPPKKAVVKKVPKKIPEKSAPAPLTEEQVVVEETPEVMEEEVVEEQPAESVQMESPEPVAEDEEAKELIVTPEAAAVLSAAAQRSIDTPPTEEVSPEDAYVKAHISEIMALLRKNLYYPRMARKRGIQGKVVVRFELMSNGEINHITVVEAERDILARAAVTTIERLEGKFPLPDQMLVLHVPIMYQLN